MAAIDLSRALEVARRAVDAAGDASLAHFRTDLVIETKSDRSPVTAADRAADAAIIAILSAAFPDHAILTEESGAVGAKSPTRWIVDPLDGTRGFSRGGSFWGPLVALEHEGEVVVGAMKMPALGTAFVAAKGMGTTRFDASGAARMKVSTVSDPSAATIQLGETGAILSPPHGAGVTGLIRAAASTRGFGDLAGVAALLEGRADVWLEAGVKIWDVAPHAILVAEAGGRFTDFGGTLTIESPNVVGTNGLLHEHVLSAIRSA